MIRFLAMTLAALWSFHSGAAETFKFHLLSEPHSLDPQSSAAASGNYLFHNIYRGLFVFSRERGLEPEGAQSCKRHGLAMTCQLRKQKWSDGSPVRAQDYVNSFRRLLDPDNKSSQADVLFTLKHAREIWAGKRKPAELGVEALSDLTLKFYFQEKDPEFEYRLIHPALTPLPPGGFAAGTEPSHLVVNGPYRIVQWNKGTSVKLVANANYPRGNPARPPLEAFFIDEDSTALRLYESGKLTFLRRLVASEFPRFREKPEFHQVPMARFDYVGFGPALLGLPEARRALTRGAEFADYSRLFGSYSPAGCPSLPSAYLDRVECMKPDFKEAKKAASTGPPPKLIMKFSKMGGDDIVRAVEWFQGQWKKNLGWSVELSGQEQTTYIRELKDQPPAIFRKGVSLDRPTCLAALEVFLKDNPENYIRLDDARYEKLVQSVAKASGLPARRKACREAVAYLLSLDRIIPLGEMYFTVLASTRFKGWDLNELNQLDLSRLTGP